MRAISVDLASRRYRDNGIALLERDGSTVLGKLYEPSGLGLRGAPEPTQFAERLLELAGATEAQGLILDGPQGWKDPGTGFEHCRVCEKRLSTPGKTGVLGSVKPPSMKRYVEFSISLFDAFEQRGWSRFGAESRRNDGITAESFPTSAWRTLELTSLPSKRRTTKGDIKQRVELLGKLVGLIVEDLPNHDELQALVAGLGGLGMMDDDALSAKTAGVAPHQKGGVWVEGFIVNPFLREEGR